MLFSRHYGRHAGRILLLLLLTLPSWAASQDAPGFADRLAAAEEALRSHQLDQAEELYRDLMASSPQQVGPYQGLAEVFYARGERDRAVELLLDVGRELAKVSRYGESVAPLERAAELAPERREALALLGRALGEDRRYREAVNVLERAVERGAQGVRTLLYLASSYWETGRYAEAEEIYRRTLRLHGNAPLALYHYGQFLLWQGRVSEARARLEEASMKFLPEGTKSGGNADFFFHLGRARSEAGDADGAEEAYERALELDATHRQARRALDRLRARGPAGTPRARRTRPRDHGDGVILVDVAADAGLRFRHDPGTTAARHLPETMGAGLAWLDYDGDGWLDLYLVQSGPFPGDDVPLGGPKGGKDSEAAVNRLLRNRGVDADGLVTFEDVTARSAAGDRAYGQGAVAADVDGDGRQDLYLTNYGGDVLLANRGDGTFEDRTAQLGLGTGGWSSSAALADADGDSDLDLYVTGYVDYDPDHGHFCGDTRPDYCNVAFFTGVDDVFLRQRADGTFTEETLAVGLANSAGRGLGVVWTDLDADGKPDIYVANDLDPNRLYRNVSTGGRVAFEDVSLVSGAAWNGAGDGEAGMGLAVADVNGDGRPEIAVTNFDTETNTLYVNHGDLLFDDASAVSGFGLPSFNLLGFGIVAADLDLDGDLDYYVANGHVFERPTRDTVERAQRDLLLLGDGRGRFTERPLPGTARLSRGAVAADYDNDGDPDVAVSHNGDVPALLRNDSSSPRWLGVELLGGGRNSQAVGARVTLVTTRRRQVRQVMAGTSYQSSADRRVLFAWPAGESVRRLEIVWPSGRRSRLRGFKAGLYLRVREPDARP